MATKKKAQGTGETIQKDLLALAKILNKVRAYDNGQWGFDLETVMDDDPSYLHCSDLFDLVKTRITKVCITQPDIEIEVK